jgi:hypothetical protein
MPGSRLGQARTFPVSIHLESGFHKAFCGCAVRFAHSAYAEIVIPHAPIAQDGRFFPA